MKGLFGVHFVIVIGLFAFGVSPAGATGTVRVQQHDGSEKTYKHVTVRMNDGNLAVISADGAGTLIVGKSACTRVKSLLRCLPYDAVLTQYKSTYHIAVTSGTLWINPGDTPQMVPSSGAHLAPRGVLLSMRTKAGTSVSLTGTADEIQK